MGVHDRHTTATKSIVDAASTTRTMGVHDYPPPRD